MICARFPAACASGLVVFVLSALPSLVQVHKVDTIVSYKVIEA